LSRDQRDTATPEHHQTLRVSSSTQYITEQFWSSL